MMRDGSTSSGFVLVNALILVAAMTAAAVFLLARAEDGRARLEVGQQADVLSANLDAFEAHAHAVLLLDSRESVADGVGEAWARPLREVALDQGTVSGRLEDLQGRFNVNWLAGPSRQEARNAFDMILDRLGVSPAAGDAIAGFVSAEGPANREAYAALDPAMIPLGGPILMVSQVRALPEVTERDFARLTPYVAALPSGTKLNVNTASDLVLSAVIPELSASQRAVLIDRRAGRPYESVAAMIEELTQGGVEDSDAGLAGNGRLTVTSEWFGGGASARLSGREARREIVFWRPMGAGAVLVEWRVSFFGED